LNQEASPWGTFNHHLLPEILAQPALVSEGSEGVMHGITANRFDFAPESIDVAGSGLEISFAPSRALNMARVISSA
jgi:hypothetical protein